MADPTIDALQRRVDALEVQVKALLDVIAVSPGGAVSIDAPGGFSLRTGSHLTVAVGTSMTVVAATNIGFSASREIAFEGRNCKMKASGDLLLESGEHFAISGRKTGVLTMGDGLDVKSGEAALGLKKDGSVNLLGHNITIRAGGKIAATANSDVVIKGSKILQN